MTDQVNQRLAAKPKKIWIDLDNSPHVPFFLPIIDSLEARGYKVVLSARNSYQVCELLELHGLKCKVIGGHWGKNRLLKIIGTCLRSLSLIPFVLKNRPALAVSHGSRAQMLVSVLTNTPTIVMYDYEFAFTMNFLRSIWTFTPQYLSDSKKSTDNSHSLSYPGLKEDVYAPRLRPDLTLRSKLGIADNEIVATVRPPAIEAHYHNHDSEVLFQATLDLLMNQSAARVILLPRNERQASSLRNDWTDWIQKGRIVIPAHAVDGMNLIWMSDFVVSGGGTMNREAAALGVPVYSIFRGRVGAVDHYLAEEGRLVLLESAEDVRNKIHITHRQRIEPVPSKSEKSTLDVIVNGIISVLENHSLRPE
jgi:predicted glycosyltransferase